MKERTLLERLMPPRGQARVLARALRQVLRQPRSASGRFNRENFGHFLRVRRQRFKCPICGHSDTPLFDFPDVRLRREHRIGVLRETLQCRGCLASMRQRSLAVALLDYLGERWGEPPASIASLAQNGLRGLRLLDTDGFSAISELLRGQPGYLRCSYLPEQPWGREVSPGYFNIDLQRIDFADASFDLVLSSDVMEHVRDCDAAHAEVHRILRPRGAYVFNVPYEESSAHNIVLVDTSTQQDVHLCPPQLHGDPLSDGVLAYRVFGRELIEQLSSLGFAVRFLRLDRPDTMIIDGDVFVAQKIDK